MSEENKAVSIVTIKRLLPLWKGEEAATNIELVELEEYGFSIVSQKGLYKPEDKGVLIAPDYCLPDNSELFSSFTSPDGNPNKTKLGKGNRIRAIKFNFHKGDGMPVFSTGILLPFNEVEFELKKKRVLDEQGVTEEVLNRELGVTKFEEPETGHSGLAAGYLPSGMSKTDETNFENVVRGLQFPITLWGTVKYDGSSCSVFFRSEEDKGICSRTFKKKLVQKVVSYYESPLGEKATRFFDKDIKQKGFRNEVTGVFFVEVPEDYKAIESDMDDSWVKLGTPALEKLEQYCKDTGQQLALRSEIYGQGLKGSGNKNNPHSKLKQGIVFYGLDDFSNGITIPLPMDKFFKLCSFLDLPTVDLIFHKEFQTEEELRQECADYFNGNLVEGIVLRNDTGTFSSKLINNIYDSTK